MDHGKISEDTRYRFMEAPVVNEENLYMENSVLQILNKDS